MRCTHENALIEELEALAEWCRERAEWQWADPERAWAYGRTMDHIRERIATLRAQRAPVRYTEG